MQATDEARDVNNEQIKPRKIFSVLILLSPV